MAALTADEMIGLLRETEALLEGHFLLTSGLHSPRYVQCARFLQHPHHAARAGRALAEAVQSLGPVDVVVGPALGGILVAHELARALGVRALFTEREGERMALRRGLAIRPGERVVIAEDVVTTGRSSGEVAEVVATQGGTVVGVAALVDRRAGDVPWPVLSLVRMEIATYAPDACPLCQRGIPVVKPGSRGASTGGSGRGGPS